MKDVLGPLIGRSSDGDSRRRKLMLQCATSEHGERYRPIPREEGFIFLYPKVNSNDGILQITGLHDQDYVHNIKK